MWKEIAPAFQVTILLTIVTGLLYPGVVTGLCQLLFQERRQRQPRIREWPGGGLVLDWPEFHQA